MSKISSSSSGIGFCGLLTVLFVGLKLTGFIDWGWLWVLSPLCLPFVPVLTVFVVIVVLGWGIELTSKVMRKTKRKQT